MAKRMAIHVLSVLTLLPASLLTQTPGPEFSAQLSFEAQQTFDPPTGWKVVPAGAAVLDNVIVHGGRGSARIERPASSPGTLSGITKSIPLQTEGHTIEIRGFLRTREVTGYAGLFLREEGESGVLEFDDMRRIQLTGTNDWKEYTLSLPRNPRANNLVFGVLVNGTGTVWADDLELLFDAPPDPGRDHEFDQGSHISLDSPTPLQLDNLVTLGKVWGFLKYHHRAVTEGRVNWDYELFRVTPAILAAPDRATANRELVEWVARLGPPASCNPCVSLTTTNIQLRPVLEWLDDETSLGKDLSLALHAIYVNRPSGSQYYVSVTPNRNALFLHELPYDLSRSGDVGFRILAVYRFWNVIEYWFP